MHVTEATDRALQKGISEAAVALTSVTAGEAANGIVTNDTSSLQATMAVLQHSPTMMQQTILNQQAQLDANTTQ